MFFFLSKPLPKKRVFLKT